MKLLTVIYDSSIEESMKELLDGLEVRGATWIYDVFGRGGRGAKMSSPVFPGTNNMVFLSLADEEVGRVHRSIRRLQNSYRLKPGITILQQEIQELP